MYAWIGVMKVTLDTSHTSLLFTCILNYIHNGGYNLKERNDSICSQTCVIRQSEDSQRNEWIHTWMKGRVLYSVGKCWVWSRSTSAHGPFTWWRCCKNNGPKPMLGITHIQSAKLKCGIYTWDVYTFIPFFFLLIIL